MARKDKWLQVTAIAAILAGGVALEGCQAVREATGAVKQPPDEFTVLTKAPLVIPPDYNLRPPQPGVASRNEVDPDQQAQAALFAPSATEQAAALGTDYSEGEKLLLSRSSALTVDPNIRRTVNADVGQEDQGPAFASKVLYEGANPPPRIASGASTQIGSGAGQVQSEGFFGRNFGFLGLGGSESTAAIEQPQMVAANQPAYAPAPPPVAAPQPMYVPPPQIAAPQVYAPAPQIYAPAPQMAAPQMAAPAGQVYAPAPQIYAPAPQLGAPQGQPVQPQMVAAPPPPPQYAQPQPAYPQAAYPQPGMDEQPGWFTRNFVMSPKQREALAAGQPLSTVAPQYAAEPPQPVPAYAAQQQQAPQYAVQPGPQPQYAVQPGPQPQYAVQPGSQPQYAQPQYAQQQPVYRPTVAQAPAGPKPEAKNLYQYLFGVPQPAGVTQVSAPMPQAQPQQQYIQLPPQQQGQPQPVQPQPQPQPQPEKEGWLSRVFGL